MKPLDPVVQAAFVTIVAFLLNLAAIAANFPISLEVLNAVAAGIVLYILRFVGMAIVRTVLPVTEQRGLISSREEQK